MTSGRLPEPGEDNAAAVDKTVVDKGAGIGSTIKVGDRAVTVVGVTQDSNYQLQPTIWTTADVARDAVFCQARDSWACTQLQRGGPGVRKWHDCGINPPVNGTAVLSTEEAALAIRASRNSVQR